MTTVDWNQELIRAALPQAVLAVLRNGESHGYAIAELLREHGFERIKGGTLYPLLKRLEDQGLVEHRWQHDKAGPGRKQFALTGHGRTELERAVAAWQQMDNALTTLRSTRKEQP